MSDADPVLRHVDPPVHFRFSKGVFVSQALLRQMTTMSAAELVATVNVFLEAGPGSFFTSDTDR